MKKEPYRDYATEAFRFLALEGSSMKYKQKIWNEAIEEQRRAEINGSGISCPTEAAIMRADEAIFNAEAAISDLEAAEFARDTLEKMRGIPAVKALKTVYMQDPDKHIGRGEIEDRVHYSALNYHASERTIYGWLALARKLFAERRGLRI